MRHTYVDTSALVKLVRSEPETCALEAWIASTATGFVASAITETELLRAALGETEEDWQRANRVLAGIDLVGATPGILRSAGGLLPARLRSLDAIHLATALELRDSVDAVLTYDKRMAEAARMQGFAVVSPGAALQAPSPLPTGLD